jgi:outer membrane protein assembly factor BamB
MRYPLLAAALSGTVLLSGCSSLSSLNPFDSSTRAQPTPLTSFQARQQIQLKWAESLGSELAGGFAPVYAQGNVVLAGSNGTVREWDALTGRRMSEWGIKRQLSAGVAANADNVYVGTSDGALLALDRKTSQKRWEATLTSYATEAPVLAGDVVIVRANDGRITGFDAKDGHQLWTNARVLPQLLLKSSSTMQLVGNEALLVGQPGGRVVVLRPTNGEVMWDSVLASPRGGTELERVTDVVSRPQYDNGQVCAVTYQGRVGCLDARSGGLAWARELSSSRGVAIGERDVYATADDGSVQAFDRTTGRSMWKLDALKHRDVSGPVRLGRFVLVADGQGYLHLLSNEDGSIVGRIRTDINGAQQPIPLGDSVLVYGTNGRIALVSLG